MAGINLITKIEENKSGGSTGSKVFGMDMGLDATDLTRLLLHGIGVALVYGSLHFIDVKVSEETSVLTVQIQELETKGAELKQRLGAVQDFARESTVYDKQMQDLRKKLEYLEKLSQGRNRVVRMIDYAINRMPQQIWMSELEIDTGEKKFIKMQGMAMSLQEVSDFMVSLEGAIFYPSWKLVESTNPDAAKTNPASTTAAPSESNAGANGATQNRDIVGAKQFIIEAEVVGS